MTHVISHGGDDGTTGLAGSGRLRKNHPRITAIGELDELNATLGAARAFVHDLDLQEILESLQRDLFTIGARLADSSKARPRACAKTGLTSADVNRLETRIARFEAVLPPLQRFTFPGGAQSGAMLHMSRTVARRAERAIVALDELDPIDPLVLVYLNRLSSLLYVLAREANRREGVPEEEWRPTS
ncbi:MAG: cob(I)yrinic acid a,c-diamide adenosyltransferase [Vicinamibacteria bacterium]|nr:cob(I)yrinic acid a,c-diamide adenosyltransferase [Vicinamibacteria bacterium]